MHKSTDKVIIRDLVLEISAGIYDHEKEQTQRVIFNVILDVESNKGKTLSSIDNVVSYENITNQITHIAQRKHYELLEELAEEIAALCLSIKLVLAVTIRIEKPDIIKEVQSVGIEILRTRIP